MKPCTRALAAQLGHLYVQGYFQVSRKVEGVKLHGHLGRSSHKKAHAQLKLNVVFHQQFGVDGDLEFSCPKSRAYNRTSIGY